MNIDEVLREIRYMVKCLTEGPISLENQRTAAFDLAYLVLGLDEHLTAGGESPQEWRRDV